MNILAIDTCFGACSVAVARSTPQGVDVPVFLYEAMQRGHAEALMPMIAEAMRDADLDFRALDRIAVTHGPGTFTGLRVGVAAARGLATALSIPVVGISSLEVLAHTALATCEVPRGVDWIGAMMATGRDQVFAEFLACDTATSQGPQLLAIVQAARALPSGRGFLVGSAAGDVANTAWRDEAARQHVSLGGRDLQPAAEALARLANERAATAVLTPLYLRAPDVKPPPPSDLRAHR